MYNELYLPQWLVKIWMLTVDRRAGKWAWPLCRRGAFVHWAHPGSPALNKGSRSWFVRIRLLLLFSRYGHIRSLIRFLTFLNQNMPLMSSTKCPRIREKVLNLSSKSDLPLVYSGPKSPFLWRWHKKLTIQIRLTIMMPIRIRIWLYNILMSICIRLCNTESVSGSCRKTRPG